MTEDDTFNMLKRPPTRAAMFTQWMLSEERKIAAKKHSDGNGDINNFCRARENYIKSHGWSIEEYRGSL